MSINPEDYSPNSDKSKIKKPDPVVKSKAIPKKKNEISKLANSFISDDVTNIREYIVSEVLIPSLKNMIVDGVTNGIRMLFYGSSSTVNRSDRRTSYGNGIYTDYSRNYNQSNPRRHEEPRSLFTFTEYTVGSREEANQLLDSMRDEIYNYGAVSVAFYYDLLQVTAPYTANNYGWKDLSRARVVSELGGQYSINFPSVVSLKK